MRTLLVVTVAAGIFAAVVLKQGETPTTQAPATKNAGALAPKAPAAAPAAQPKEQNWSKRALDRATEVKRQVTEQRKSDGTR